MTLGTSADTDTDTHLSTSAEMGDIKGEILSLSEKYSIKCLETASLEERVETQHRSLQEANQRVFQLDARWDGVVTD